MTISVAKPAQMVGGMRVKGHHRMQGVTKMNEGDGDGIIGLSAEGEASSVEKPAKRDPRSRKDSFDKPSYKSNIQGAPIKQPQGHIRMGHE